MKISWGSTRTERNDIFVETDLLQGVPKAVPFSGRAEAPQHVGPHPVCAEVRQCARGPPGVVVWPAERSRGWLGEVKEVGGSVRV
ncbi:hypothetical protein CEXT_708661 [Caerostris extrusa]|uniref:Uncharacterized protein n=1 Tax=Caerostris extrusa TaxID=172846 RepID=A0AAV4VJ31_CAEEX|nr:hypothetical protein CEXT_708661 [Caerostris extrusa]